MSSPNTSPPKRRGRPPKVKEAPAPTPPPQGEMVVPIPLTELHPFPDHPFKVRDDEAMKETTESVKECYDITTDSGNSQEVYYGFPYFVTMHKNGGCVMSDLYNRILALCEERNISGYRLCKDAGVQPSVLTDLKMGRQTGLSAKNADKIASCLGVSVAYLLGTETKEAPVLTEKDRRDVAKDVYQIMQSLESNGDLMFDGVPMSEESKAAMAAAMRIGLEEARKRNKATYTPKKFRKG